MECWPYKLVKRIGDLPAIALHNVFEVLLGLEWNRAAKVKHDALASKDHGEKKQKEKEAKQQVLQILLVLLVLLVLFRPQN